ncbi:MAG: hypothetical protein WAM97_12735 [Acidimicrobiales bacterium]
MSELTDTLATLPEHFTAEDLTALALAADPDQPLDPDALPISQYLGDASEATGLLPSWYMAAPAKRHAHKGVQFVAIAVIAAFVIIEAFGLCSTYGQPLFH